MKHCSFYGEYLESKRLRCRQSSYVYTLYVCSAFFCVKSMYSEKRREDVFLCLQENKRVRMEILCYQFVDIVLEKRVVRCMAGLKVGLGSSWREGL